MTAGVGKIHVHTHKSGSSYLRSRQVEDQSIMVMALRATETPMEFFTWKLYMFSWGVGRI